MPRAGCPALWVRRHRGARGTPASLLHAGDARGARSYPWFAFPSLLSGALGPSDTPALPGSQNSSFFTGLPTVLQPQHPVPPKHEWIYYTPQQTILIHALPFGRNQRLRREERYGVGMPRASFSRHELALDASEHAAGPSPAHLTHRTKPSSGKGSTRGALSGKGLSKGLQANHWNYDFFKGFKQPSKSQRCSPKASSCQIPGAFSKMFWLRVRTRTPEAAGGAQADFSHLAERFFSGRKWCKGQGRIKDK